MSDQLIGIINVPEAKVFVQVELSETGAVSIFTGRLLPFDDSDGALHATLGVADQILVDNSTGRLQK